MKLAAATRDGVWVDRMVEMHAATGRPLSLDLTRELAFVLRHVEHFDRRQLVEYQSQMKKSTADAANASGDEASRCALIVALALP